MSRRSMQAHMPTASTERARLRARRPNIASSFEKHWDPARGQQNASATLISVKPASIRSSGGLPPGAAVIMFGDGYGNRYPVSVLGCFHVDPLSLPEGS